MKGDHTSMFDGILSGTGESRVPFGCYWVLLIPTLNHYRMLLFLESSSLIYLETVTACSG